VFIYADEILFYLILLFLFFAQCLIFVLLQRFGFNVNKISFFFIPANSNSSQFVKYFPCTWNLLAFLMEVCSYTKMLQQPFHKQITLLMQIFSALQNYNFRFLFLELFTFLNRHGALSFLCSHTSTSRKWLNFITCKCISHEVNVKFIIFNAQLQTLCQQCDVMNLRSVFLTKTTWNFVSLAQLWNFLSHYCNIIECKENHMILKYFKVVMLSS
jgi:hypothetical protein